MHYGRRLVPTPVRTAAAATVAMRVLARKGSTVMAMLGAGDTARAAVPVMAQVFALKEIRVTSRTPELAAELRQGSRQGIWD
jgi:ornithine cyclodeaminase/alanine dehydrogenase-like protein (mu-crystallin family)